MVLRKSRFDTEAKVNSKTSDDKRRELWGKCQAQETKRSVSLGDRKEKSQRHLIMTKVIFNEEDKIIHQMIGLFASIYNCIQAV